MEMAYSLLDTPDPAWLSSARDAILRADALGANVIVTEVDPVKAIEARMDGYQVMTMKQAITRSQSRNTTRPPVSPPSDIFHLLFRAFFVKIIHIPACDVKAGQ